MPRLRAVIFAVLLIGITSNFTIANAQTPTTIPMSLPIHGYFAFDAESRLIVVDTFTGTAQVVDELSPPRPITNPHWDGAGEKIAYNNPLDTKILQPLSNPPQTLLTAPYQPELGVFGSEGWNPDNAFVLGIVSGNDLNYYDLQTLSGDGSRATLKRYMTKSPLPENPQLEFFTITRASWNPIYDQWIIAQIDTFPVGTESNSERPVVTVGLLFNQLTGETHLVDDTLVSSIFSIPTDAWSPDGQHVVLETRASDTRIEIVSLLDGDGSWQFQPIASAPSDGLTTVIGWLGVSDLLLIRERNQSQEEVYSIAQIVDGQLMTREFFRIPTLDFTISLSHNIGAGTWHLTASPDEQAILSCIFDQTLPSA